MSAKQEDVNILLRLYEIRREEAMRRARDWFTTDFNPQSTQDIYDVIVSEDSPKYRMVSTYWDMACAFVNHGAIDEQLFNDVNSEHVAVYAKLQPFLEEFRAATNTPWYLKHLEQLVTRMPDAEERIATLRRFMKRRLEAREKRESKTSEQAES